MSNSDPIKRDRPIGRCQTPLQPATPLAQKILLAIQQYYHTNPDAPASECIQALEYIRFIYTEGVIAEVERLRREQG